MDDGNIDLYDDSGITDDSSADSGDQEISYDGDGDPVSDDSNSESSDQDSSVDDSGSDGTDEQDTEMDGESSEKTDTEESKTSEDELKDAEDENSAEDEEAEVLPVVDPEIMLDIRDTLHKHTDSVDDFFSSLSVSGNMLEVSLDSGSVSLLKESVEKQDKILDSMDYMNGLILLTFFVLVFDLLQRFAKRIIKNFMGGEKNGTNS